MTGEYGLRILLLNIMTTRIIFHSFNGFWDFFYISERNNHWTQRLYGAITSKWSNFETTACQNEQNACLTYAKEMN